MAFDMTFKKLLVDTAQNTVVNYSKEQANEAIRQQFREVLGLSEGASMKEIRRALRANKAATYAIIEDTIDDRLQSGWGENPFFNRFVEVKNLADGDRNEFYVPSDTILTVTKFSGNHHDLTRQKLGVGKTISVTTDWYGIKVYEEFERFMAGRIDWAEFIDKLYEAMDKKINDMLYDSFLGLDKFVPGAYAIKGDITTETVLELVEKVEAATGHEAFICGTRTALSKITNLTNAGMWSDAMKDQRNTLGQLGTWEGVELLRIPQVLKQGTREFAYNQNKFYVLPKVDNRPIKLVYEGDGYFNENTTADTNRDMTVEAEYQTKLGIATVVGYDYAVGEFNN